MSHDTNPAFKTVVTFYGAYMLPRLRGMTRAQLVAVTSEASEVSGQVPIHMHPVATLNVPLWSARPLTGGQVAALMTMGLWVLCNEDENIAAPLVESWPIREALILCDGPDGGRRVATYEPPGDPAQADPLAEPFPLLALIDAARGTHGGPNV